MAVRAVPFLATIVTQALDIFFGFGTIEASSYRLGWTGWASVATTGGWITHLFHLPR